MGGIAGDFLESLEAGDAGAASLRWPLATQLSTKVGKNHKTNLFGMFFLWLKPQPVKENAEGRLGCEVAVMYESGTAGGRHGPAVPVLLRVYHVFHLRRKALF